MENPNCLPYKENMVVEYVCDIPLNIRLDLCDMLDVNESWKELGNVLIYVIIADQSLQKVFF